MSRHSGECVSEVPVFAAVQWEAVLDPAELELNLSRHPMPGSRYGNTMIYYFTLV